MFWRRLNIVYETVMIVLVIVSLIAVMSDGDSGFKHIHKIIWYIFLVDVTVRFIRATVKWKYVKNNTFDIVSVIPLEDIFLLARFARFLRLFRYKNLVKRYAERIRILLIKVGFTRLSIYLASFNILMSIVLWRFTKFTIIESSIWVWGNFLKFNYKVNLEGLLLLSIGIKIIGIMYMGILISEAVTLLRKWYEGYLARRKILVERSEEKDLKG